MPNSKYIPPALRLIVTEKGAQYPAFADGTRFSQVIFTQVSQTTDEALSGIATLLIEMYVSPGPEVQGRQFAIFENGTLKQGDNEMEIDNWILREIDPDLADKLYQLSFTTKAYPDPTTI